MNIGQILEIPHGSSDNVFYFVVTDVNSIGEVLEMRSLTKKEAEEYRLTKSKDSDTLKE